MNKLTDEEFKLLQSRDAVFYLFLMLLQGEAVYFGNNCKKFANDPSERHQKGFVHVKQVDVEWGEISSSDPKDYQLFTEPDKPMSWHEYSEWYVQEVALPTITRASLIKSLIAADQEYRDSGVVTEQTMSQVNTTATKVIELRAPDSTAGNPKYRNVNSVRGDKPRRVSAFA